FGTTLTLLETAIKDNKSTKEERDKIIDLLLLDNGIYDKKEGIKRLVTNISSVLFKLEDFKTIEKILDKKPDLMYNIINLAGIYLDESRYLKLMDIIFKKARPNMAILLPSMLNVAQR